MKNDDVELIQRVLAGDENAFAELVKKYQKPVHALAWRKIGDFHIAEEITQDAFLKVYQRLHTLKDPNQFSGWLYVIATRRCYAWLRKKRIRTQPLEDAETTMILRDAYSRHVAEERAKTAVEAQREVVKRLLSKLKESERTVMTLHYLGEMTCEEISKFLGVSAGTIKSRLQRARNRLQKEEPMIREALDYFQISPNLTDNIMREVTRLKTATPSGGKPLVPWAVAASSVVLIVLMLGIGSQYLARFQDPYSLDAQTEMTIELVDAPIVLDLEEKPDVRNQLGENSDAIDRNNITKQNSDAILFAAAQADDEGKSETSKQQWVSVNEPSASGPVWSLSATPEREIYAVLDDAGICKLTPDGETWQLLTPMKGGGYSSTAHIAKRNNTLYFTPGDELLVSTDEGQTWQLVESPVRQGGNCYDFVFTNETFYLRVGSEVYRSDDAGKSWSIVSIGEGEQYSIRYLVAIKNTLFAGVDAGKVPGLYRLDGDKWIHLQLPVAVGVSSIRSLVTTKNNLYVTVVPPKAKRQFSQRKGRTWWIFRSTDMGNSWTDITPTNAWSLHGSPPSIVLVAIKDTILVIGSHDVSVARSIDSGKTWTYEENTGISRKNAFFSSVMHAVALNGKTFYVGGTTGIHRSTDGGKSWHRFNTGLRSRVDKLFAFQGKNKTQKQALPVLYAITESKYAAGDLVTSMDGGKSWKTVDVVSQFTKSDQDDPYRETPVPRIVTIQTSGDVLYAKGESYEKSRKTLMYRISDDGNTLIPIEGMPAFDSQSLYDELEKLQQGLGDSSIKWPPSKSFIENLQKNNVGSSEFMKEAAMAPGSELLQRGLQGTFAVSDDTFYMEYNHKLFRWKLGEKEWHDTGLEETAGKKSVELQLAVLGDIVYVGTRNGKLIQSIDGGDTWWDVTPQVLVNLKSPIYKPIRDIAFAGSTVYVVTREGVIKSNDGKNWHTITDKVGEHPIIEKLAVSGTTLYGISMTNRFYRLDSDSGKWKQVAAEIAENVTSLTVDRNVLYVGTGRRGVLRFDVSR